MVAVARRLKRRAVNRGDRGRGARRLECRAVNRGDRGSSPPAVFFKPGFVVTPTLA